MSEDYGTEAEALSEWDDDWGDHDEDERGSYTRLPRTSQDRGGDRPQPDRWRCLHTGCNPRLDEYTAREHKTTTGHRVAKWPVRSAEGRRRARERNRTGYYDQYNVGAQSAQARGIR